MTPVKPLYFESHSSFQLSSPANVESSMMSRRYANPVVYTVYGAEYWEPTS